MKSTNLQAQAEGVSLSCEEVAVCTGLTTYEVKCLHPEGFGSPGHFTMNRQGVVIYSERGLALLADAIEVAPRPACKWRGMEAARWMRAAAHALRMEVESRKDLKAIDAEIAAAQTAARAEFSRQVKALAAMPRRKFWWQQEAS